MTIVVTEAMIDKVRRMTNEPDTTTYDDVTISGYIVDNGGDLNGTASEIWYEKVAVLQETTYDISADGASYKHSQKLDNAMNLAKKFASKRTPKSSVWVKSPEEVDTTDDLQVG